MARWLVPGIVAVACASGVARADQFLLQDFTYTHDPTTTKDSHYRVKPLAGTPKNWRMPVDYFGGTIYVRTEVLTKPSAARTVHWICFEATPSYDCTTSPVYTTTGVLNWSNRSMLSKSTLIDWTRGIINIASILKDDKGAKVAPENVGAAYAAMFMPTTLHVTITVVSAGSVYVPPGDGGVFLPTDAGRPDATAASGDARTDRSAADGGAPPAAEDAAAPGRPTATDAPPATEAPPADDQPASTQKHASGGCALASRAPRPPPAVLLLAAVALVARRRPAGAKK